MRRLLALLLAVLVVWLAVPATGHAEPVPVAVAASYTYDVHHGSVVTFGAAPERGPPVVGSRDTTYDDADGSTHGVTASSDEATPRVATYDDLSEVAQVAQAAARTTWTALGANAGDARAISTASVAANTAEGAALAAGRTSGAAAELNVGGQVITDVSTGVRADR